MDLHPRLHFKKKTVGFPQTRYSFWDQVSDELLEKSNRIPVRQKNPPDNYAPDKVGGQVTLEQFQQNRKMYCILLV